jgi:hypothetical protein
LRFLGERAELEVFLDRQFRENLATFRNAGDPRVDDPVVGSPVMSMPSKTIRPCRGKVSARIERIKVVLPEPFDPIKQVMLPGSTVSEIPLSTSALS